MTYVDVIERSAESMRAWLSDLATELGRPGDHEYAYRVLRAFLHTLRDRLPVNETAHLAAQLPELLRGVYYEGWRPSATPQRYHDRDEFLSRVALAAMLAGETQASFAVEASAKVLARHVTPGELHKVRLVLPHEIAELLDPNRASSRGPVPQG